MTDRLISARKLPTREQLADHLGVPEISVGPIYPPTRNLPGFAEVVLDGRIERVSLVIDRAADFPPRPTADVRPAKRITVVVPDKYRRRREREEHQRAEAARRAEVERRHNLALAHMAERVVASSISQRGAIPAWVVQARAVDQARAARGVQAPVAALTASALDLDGGMGPPRPTRPARACRVCSSTVTAGGVLCEGCRGDSDLLGVTQ